MTIQEDEISKRQLGPYLAGLIEGDGYIYVPSNESSKEKK